MQISWPKASEILPEGEEKYVVGLPSAPASLVQWSEMMGVAVQQHLESCSSTTQYIIQYIIQHNILFHFALLLLPNVAAHNLQMLMVPGCLPIILSPPPCGSVAGPGPGKYGRQPLTGIKDHDFTKYAEPAYTMRVKSSERCKMLTS